MKNPLFHIIFVFFVVVGCDKHTDGNIINRISQAQTIEILNKTPFSLPASGEKSGFVLSAEENAACRRILSLCTQEKADANSDSRLLASLYFRLADAEGEVIDIVLTPSVWYIRNPNKGGIPQYLKYSNAEAAERFHNELFSLLLKSYKKMESDVNHSR